MRRDRQADEGLVARIKGGPEKRENCGLDEPLEKDIMRDCGP